MATATTEAPENKITEEQKINQWRQDFFHEIMGNEYDPEVIEHLVDSPVSPHEARQLKISGCPVDLIPKILL